MNPATGRITGLIDFDDASWGDPALDFVALRAAMGVAFTDAMAAAYMLPVDSGFRGRVNFMARVKSLDWLYDAHVQGADAEKHRRWVENAFS